jgi:hypothetical protein
MPSLTVGLLPRFVEVAKIPAMPHIEITGIDYRLKS